MSDRIRIIGKYEERFWGLPAVALILPVWLSPEGPVIIDGNHRACALYRLSPPKLDVDVLVLPAPEGSFDLLPGPRIAG